MTNTDEDKLDIPENEFQLRIERIQEFMVEKELGGLLAYSSPRAHMWHQTGHVGWLTNWANRDRIPESMVLVAAQGEPVLLFSGLAFMFPQVREVSWMRDIRIVRSFDPNAVAIQSGSREAGEVSDFAGETMGILRERGLEGKKVGLVGIENMPVPIFEGLTRGIGEDKLEVVDDVVAALRAVKSPHEIVLMKKAAALSDLGYETFLKIARARLRGIEAIAEAERAVRSHGTEEVLYWIANVPDGHWHPSIVDIKPTSRTLNFGDQIMMCSYVAYKGYWAHAHRCGYLGKEAQEMTRIWEPAFEAQCAAVEKMRPGVPVSEVVRAARHVAEKHGYSLHGGRIGHGIGVDYGERPFLTEDNQALLENGNVAIVHTAFTEPKSGRMLIPVGDLCLVTDDGPELLYSFPRRPFLVPG